MDVSEFKRLRNQLVKVTRKAKLAYYSNLFAHDTGRSDITWKKINTVLCRTRTPTEIESICYNGENVSECRLANVFNDFFVKQFDKPLLTADISEQDLSASEQQSIFLCPTDDQEVLSTIVNLKNSSVCDVDDLQIAPIKYIADLISRPLVHISNLILSLGVFPKKLQIAKVKLLFKGGDKNLLKNYRPISILPMFSKIIEKLLHSRLTTYFSKHAILHDFQHGFRKNHSTETALLEQKEIILKNFSDHNLTLGIYVDLSKAFDSLRHETLLCKLHSYGVRGVAYDLLLSYLSDRQQYVLIGEHSSDLKPIITGVPQGSILGPLLFSVYVNDLHALLSRPQVSVICYADDTTLLITGKTSEEIEKISVTTLSTLLAWTQRNSLVINVDKTTAVLFRPKNKLAASPKVYLGRGIIQVEDSVKVLGVHFSQNMTWDSHVEQIYKKICKTIGVINKCRHILPERIKLLLYNSLLLPQLTYAHLVWGTTTNKNFNQLFLVQKKVARIIANVPYNFHTPELFKKFKIIKVSNYYEYRLAQSYLAATKNNRFYEGLAKLKKNITAYNTRNPDIWYTPTPHNNYDRQSLTFTLPRLLNNFTSNSIEIGKLSKSVLKEYFL